MVTVNWGGRAPGDKFIVFSKFFDLEEPRATSIFGQFFFRYGVYPLELLPPQSDFQGKKFLKKNFHPFSGLDGGSSRQTVEVRDIFIGA